jgi:hypothetical protein
VKQVIRCSISGSAANIPGHHIQLTLTLKNATAAPVILAALATSIPGHRPYVKPMSVIDPANPNNGG